MLIKDDQTKPRGCGRVSIVTEEGKVVYDTFVHYGPDVPHRVDRPDLRLGVLWSDIQPWNGAQLYGNVLKVLKTAFDKSGVIIGHSIKNDISMLRDLDWSSYRCHDTQLSNPLRDISGKRQPGLKGLTEDVLGREIQTDEIGHSSVEDARATMELWHYHVQTIEEEGGNVEHSARYYLPGQARAKRTQPARECKKWRTDYLAPGHLVALPDIPGACPPGHKWDLMSSTYIPAVDSWGTPIDAATKDDKSAAEDGW